VSAPLSPSPRLWRIAGGLAIVHVVVMLGGFALEQSPSLGDPRSSVVAAYVHSDMTTIFTGGYVEYLAFLVFLPLAVLLGRLLRGRDEVSGWLAGCIGAAGVTYVAVTIAAGVAAGAAALYNGHHGAPVTTLTTVNDVRNFAFFLSIGALGVFTLAVAAAGRVTRALPTWVVWSGYVVGAVSIAAIPAARAGILDDVTLVWLVWFLALAAACLRGPRRTVTPERDRPAVGV
jgi:hypothetical protein